MRVLILCTGNSCRSQMAEAFLKKLRPHWQVVSAGTQPADRVNPFTIQVMQEVGIDISKAEPKDVAQFLDEPFDYVITVCDHARQSCPVFLGRVGQQIHIGFEDPAEAIGSEEEILTVYRKVRDQIQQRFGEFVAGKP